MRKKFLVTMIIAMLTATLGLGGCNDGPKVFELPSEVTLDDALREGGYKLVFNDDFEGTQINSKNWKVGYDDIKRRGGYYSSDSDTVFVKDSCLTIRTQYRENGLSGAGWYTGWVESATPSGGHTRKASADYKGFSSKYGYYEIRCKAPASYGIWSAFWMMPDTGNGAEGMTGNDIFGTGKDGVEVDVMESLAYQDKKLRNTNVHVIHGDGYGPEMKNDASPIYDIGDMYNEFHRYGVMWTEREYIFYVDGCETYRTTYVADGKELGVSEANEYMLLTVEIAGIMEDDKVYPGKDIDGEGKFVDHWAGDPNKNKKNKNYDFVIDYVKVYQK